MAATSMSLSTISQTQNAPQLRKKKCSEVCLELLCFEAVRLFSERQGGPAGAAALEAVGFRIGRQLAERLGRDKNRLGDTLEIIKFICKDFWSAVFKKNVDNLKTNHRGTYVLQDNSFRWLTRLVPAVAPGDPAKEELLRKTAASHLYLPAGIVRGALTHMGVVCTVEAESKSPPTCSFTIKITS